MTEIGKIICKSAVVITLMVFCFSCTKEEEPVKLATLEVITFDKGYIVIKLLNNPNRVDSIMYSNNTLGTSFKLDKTLLGYDEGDNIALLSLPIENGRRDDEVQCCFYINNSIEVGVSFEDLSSTIGAYYIDSIPTTNTNGISFYCFNGVY